MLHLQGLYKKYPILLSYMAMQMIYRRYCNNGNRKIFHTHVSYLILRASPVSSVTARECVGQHLFIAF